MFELRTITGTLQRADNTPAASAEIIFAPVAVAGASSGALLLTSPTAITSAAAGGLGGGAGGAFTVALVTITGGFVRYSCRLPDGSLLLFNLPPGSPTTLAALMLDSMA